MPKIIEGFNPTEAKRIEPLDVTEIKNFLEKEIKGQDEAVEAWARILQRALLGTPKLRKGPLAVLTEIGPSGVGKTEIAIQAARFLASKAQYGQTIVSNQEQPSVLRIDCGEYTREHEVAKILGSPPGYVGADITPRLAQTEINQYSIPVDNKRRVTIVILDEIEKAHEKLSVTLLGALDYGVITLGNGTKTNLENCIVVFTSNLGNKKVIEAQEKEGALDKSTKKKIHIDAMLEHFTPEQMGRMGGETNTLCFNELSREIVQGILMAKLDKLEKLYAKLGMNFAFQLTPKGLENLLNLGYSAKEGARRLENVLEQRISARLAGVEKFSGILPVVIDAENGEDVALYVPKQVEIIPEPKLKDSETSSDIQKIDVMAKSTIETPTEQIIFSEKDKEVLKEVRTTLNYTSVSNAVATANKSIKNRLIEKSVVIAFFFSPETQDKLKKDLKHTLTYQSAHAAVQEANKYIQMGIFTREDAVALGLTM